jgi:hypothetical protein
LFGGGETAFGAVGVVAAGVEPEDDRCAPSVEELAGDDDLVAGAGQRCAGRGGEGGGG